MIRTRLGAIAGYKFYIFNVYGRENLFVHYSFQYLIFIMSSRRLAISLVPQVSIITLGLPNISETM